MTTAVVHAETDVRSGRGTLTLDSPHNRNALSRELLRQLDASLQSLLEDPAVRVVVLTGAGDVFCSGADLKEAREPGERSGDLFIEVLRRIRRADKPILCQLNGPVRAGGVGLMSACHIVVAPASATFAFTEVRLGVAPAVIAVPVLCRISQAHARRLFVSGRSFGATEAVDIGLVDAIAPGEDVASVVDTYAADIALGAPGAVAATLQLITAINDLDYDRALTDMSALSMQLFASAEAGEGIVAWKEKRRPSWVPAAARA